jgi:drug/metabolite transporter superfamily protein YnfA
MEEMVNSYRILVRNSEGREILVKMKTKVALPLQGPVVTICTAVTTKRSISTHKGIFVLTTNIYFFALYIINRLGLVAEK